jgi:site-specific DNA-methyltransferase (adenine-specific)
LHRCRELGLSGTDFELNWKLFNARKGSHLTDLPKTKKYTPSRKDEFEFSSEIAIRYIQEQVQNELGDSVSLDKIICNPEYATRFDRIAEQLAPGFSPLEYRWIALRVRKAAGTYAKKAKGIEIPTFDLFGNSKSVRASRIPTEQGLYFFRCGDDALFVGDTDNLRNRIERHFDVSEHAGLPDWLYNRGIKALTLGIAPTPKVKPAERKILGLGTVFHFRPVFNYVGVGANAA